MEWTGYLIFGLCVGGVLFVGGICALVWAKKNGQLENFEAQAKSIFDEEEPEGQMTDFFPGSDEQDIPNKDSSKDNRIK